MNDTWGISGPVFAGSYLGLLLIPVVAASLRLRWLRAGTNTGGPLTRIEQVAMLSGGPERVADTAVAALLEREQVRLDSAGRLHLTPRHPADVLGQAVVRLIKPRSATPLTIRLLLEREPVVESLAADLTGRGLLAGPRPRRRAWLFATAGYGVLFGLGIVRLQAGLRAGHPVSFLIALLVLAVAAGIVTTVVGFGAKQAQITSAGRKALAAARKDRQLVDGPVGAVAVGGLPSHPDKDVRAAVSRVTPAQRARSAGSHWTALSGTGAVGASCGGGGGASCGGGGGGCGG